ncbi:MAG: hypothetical protein HQL64_13460 [Magnetococcales bacterium]|nr:hypothetical protein [Magnetococcales bacterium]
MWSVSQAGMAMVFGSIARQQGQGGVVQRSAGVRGRESQQPRSHNQSQDDEGSDFHALFMRALEEDDTE